VPQLVILAERVALGQPTDNKEGPVMGGFSYAEPGDGVDFAVNVHDVHVDKELGSFANVSVLYIIPDEVEDEDPQDRLVKLEAVPEPESE
jgi:hypothetical protein